MYSVLRKAAVAILLAYTLSLSPAQGANIAWVTEPRSPIADWDIGWTDLLTDAGHNVTRMNDMTELDQAKIDALNASDLVIISRSVNSGGYADGDEPQQWNGLTAPLINLSAHVARSNRWKWFDSTATSTFNRRILVDDPDHPIYGGIAVANVAQFVSSPDDELITTIASGDGGNGMVLATEETSGSVMAVLWEPGVEYYDGAGESAGAYRLFLPFGQSNISGSEEWGALNATPAGKLIFLNAVDYMLVVPEPSTFVLFGLGILSVFGLRRRQR